MPEWIWLPENKYPDNQNCGISLMNDWSCSSFCVAQFCRDYSFEKEIDRVRIESGGDTVFKLFMNGEVIENGPVCGGGDWIDIGKAPYYYTQKYEVASAGRQLHFEVFVQLGATVTCDYSCGHGGFFLSAEVCFRDGTQMKIGTDESWLCRLDHRYLSPLVYDESVLQGEFTNAAPDRTPRTLKQAEIPLLSLNRVIPTDGNTVCVMPNEVKTVRLNFNTVYAAYLSFKTDALRNVTL